MVRDYIRRLLWLVAGMVVSAVGITLMLQANIGLEPCCSRAWRSPPA